ncbi:hypothetical protein FB192DRAFT_1291785 [Mucor lusitanicus]|uniref:Uncharacterized protein n=1 Tax=Mucor circinelloides f. lusitanicus TaxID=29924 RepID=A0A8H4EX51_MUCCL|nr:hypothetical protein FB192DRAFT_1291785 [Mucor lusitanicus]
MDPRISVDETDDDGDDLRSTSSSGSSRRNSAILRPHIVLPNPRHAENRKSLDIPNDWLLPNNANSSSSSYQTSRMAPTTTTTTSGNYYTNRYKSSRNLGSSRPMVSTTFPSLSNSTPLPMDASLSASTVVRKRISQQPPKVINIRDRVSFDNNQRPASICLDTRSLHSIEDGGEESEELMGDFLLGLSKLDGNVVGGRTGSFKTSSFRRL